MSEEDTLPTAFVRQNYFQPNSITFPVHLSYRAYVFELQSPTAPELFTLPYVN